MLDMHFIRENLEAVKAGCAAKNARVDLDGLIRLDQQRREAITKADGLKAERNKASEDIGRAKKSGEDASGAIRKMKSVSDEIKALDETIRSTEEQMREIQIWIPNMPHDSVQVGDESHNEEVKTWGEPKAFSFEPKPHWDLGALHNMLEFDRAANLSGSNFVAYRATGARLVRALMNFMLDLHVDKHGYEEMWVPYIVRPEIMFGTGQLPKLEDDMYKIERDDLYLIPTAEVPVTNMHRGEILEGERLPLKFTAFTPCFRREAGSYGADTRGLMRIHQFNKVEMVKIVQPETSFDELESLLQNAEEVLQLLDLPYRVLNLASGDISFAAAKCYDIEVWTPGLDRWLEVSSCSNMTDFQARRMNLRFRKDSGAKPEYVHTLNGSGLALPRTIIAIMETYQKEDGRIAVPEVLQTYMGCEVIG